MKCIEKIAKMGVCQMSIAPKSAQKLWIEICQNNETLFNLIAYVHAQEVISV